MANIIKFYILQSVGGILMKRIIVFCPANYSSGGPELLHQLCFQLQKLGYNSFMYYYGYNATEHNTPIHKNYEHYSNPYLTTYKDNKDNICVVPEGYTQAFFHIHQGIKVLWWLSVDNFVGDFKKIKSNTKCCSEGINIKYRWKVFRHKIYDVRESDINYHLVQSEYAKDYCNALGIPKQKVLFLSDYLNDSYINRAQKNKDVQKEDYVLYNPKKGIEFTRKLIKSADFLSWKPIINMTYDEVIELMQKSKVYIDFGNHPGKDRLPREAAINGCCVITGTRGSAAYQKDVPIPTNYKIEGTDKNIPQIINLISDICKNYTKHARNFNEYRKFILGERKQFEKDTKYVFEKILKDTN